MEINITKDVKKERRQLAPPVDGASLPTAQGRGSHGVLSHDAIFDPRAALVPLPALESFREIEAKRQSYVGPTDESNWVIPGCVARVSRVPRRGRARVVRSKKAPRPCVATERPARARAF